MSGCKSREEQVCEHIHALMAEKLASYGEDPGDPEPGIEKCVRFKAKSGATDEEWSSYLDCAEKAKAWGDVEVCMGTLAGAIGKRKAGI